MPKKFNRLSVNWTLEINYADGKTESITDLAQLVNHRFASLVTAYCGVHMFDIVEVNLYDNCNHLIRQYKQYH